MPQRSNGFEKNIERAREAGRKGGKAPRMSFGAATREWLQSPVGPKEIKRLKLFEKKTGFPARADTLEDYLREILFYMAAKGSVSAIREIWDRAYGKPVSMDKMKSQEDAPTRFTTIVQVIGDGIGETHDADSKPAKETKE